MTYTRPRIPLKKDLLLFHKALTKDTSYLKKDNNVKDKKISTMVQKNEKLETAIRDITKQLLQEKKASNVLLDQIKYDAETAVTEAYCILNQSQNTKTTVEACKLAEKMRSKQKFRKGESYSAKQLVDRKLIFVLDFKTLHVFMS